MADFMSLLGELLEGEHQRAPRGERRLHQRIDEATQHGSVRELYDRLDVLEDDFRRLLLITLALCETCVRKGQMSREDLQSTAAGLDARDGAVDGRLDPRSLWSGARPASQPPTASEFLRDLEQTP